VIGETQPQDQQTANNDDFRGEFNAAEADPEAVHFDDNANQGASWNAFTGESGDQGKGLTA